jgi:two-component system, cell cycle response regulator
MPEERISVLMVEDNPGDVRLIQEMLAESNENGFLVEPVNQLSAGLERLTESGIQVVLLDLSLPDSQGLDTFTQVHAYAPDIPVIILTGLDDETLGQIAVREGAQDYLVKIQITSPILARAIRFAIERQRLVVELHTKSLVDPLTNLYNRRAFFALADRQIRIADRNQRGLLTLFIDVDNFKRINDSLGHQVGDKVLQDVANVLRDTFRHSDILARMGGDEFAILAIELDKKDSTAVTRRLRQNLKNRMGQLPGLSQLSVSIGLARYDPTQPCSVDELLGQADARMYAEKRGKSDPGS